MTGQLRKCSLSAAIGEVDGPLTGIIDHAESDFSLALDPAQ
jgi:hypothetical protein